MNIYINELKTMKPLPWLLGVGGLTVLMMSIFWSLLDDMAGLRRIINGLPTEFRAAVGIDVVLLGSVLGMFGFMMIYVWLISCMQAMLWGMSIITRERRFHTADFLMSKPRSRTGILAAKLAAVLTGLLVTTSLFGVLAAIILAATGEAFNTGNYILMLTGYFVVQLMFLAGGLFAAICVKTLKNPLSVAAVTVFGTYVLGALSSATDSSWMRFLSPYKYFDPSYLFANNRFDPPMVFLSLLFIAAALTGCFAVFRRQDIFS